MISDDWKIFVSSVIWLNWWFPQVDLRMAWAQQQSIHTYTLWVKKERISLRFLCYVNLWKFNLSTYSIENKKLGKKKRRKKIKLMMVWNHYFCWNARIDWLMMNAAEKEKNTWCQYEICLCPLKRRFLQVLLQIDSLKLAKMICILFAILEEKLQCVQLMPIIHGKIL